MIMQFLIFTRIINPFIHPLTMYQYYSYPYPERIFVQKHNSMDHGFLNNEYITPGLSLNTIIHEIEIIE